MNLQRTLSTSKGSSRYLCCHSWRSPRGFPSSERTFIVLGDLLTVNTYDSSERTFIVLGDLLTAKAYDKSEHTFNVLGVLLTVNT